MFKKLSIFLLFLPTILFASDLRWETEYYLRFINEDKVNKSYLKIEKATNKDSTFVYRFSHCMVNIPSCVPIGKQAGISEGQIIENIIPLYPLLIISENLHSSFTQEAEHLNDIIAQINQENNSWTDFFYSSFLQIPMAGISAIAGLYLANLNPLTINQEGVLEKVIMTAIYTASIYLPANTAIDYLYDYALKQDSTQLTEKLTELQSKLKKLSYYYISKEKSIYFQNQDISFFIKLIENLE